jgi:uncharacterized membrane protein (GlpM family)
LYRKPETHDPNKNMQTLAKVAISAAIILIATAIAKRFPSAAGLIGVMPLTGALVLVWVYFENRGDPQVMQHFAKGAFWGILPTFLFFFVAFLCLKKGFSLMGVLAASFAAWSGAACIHQWLLK